RPHSFAMSATVSSRPIALDRSARNCFSSGPVMSPQISEVDEVNALALIRVHPKAAVIVLVFPGRSSVSEGNRMPVFKLPLSGDVVQSIYPSFFSPTGNQFGLVNITVGQSSSPEVERDVLSDVGSYGKQIGQIADALLVVIEHLEGDADGTLKRDKAIRQFKEMMQAVAKVKEGHGREARRPRD